LDVAIAFANRQRRKTSAVIETPISLLAGQMPGRAEGVFKRQPTLTPTFAASTSATISGI
jgi:hypothetical protein